MRRAGSLVQRAARQSSIAPPLSHTSHLSSPVFFPLQSNRPYFRSFATQSTQAPSGAPSDDLYSSPTPPTGPANRKRARPSRVTDLYDALIYEDGGTTAAEPWRKIMAVDTSGSPISEAASDLLKTRLEDCRQHAHAEQALAVLDDVHCNGRIPSARAVIMAIEACLPAEEFALAEDALTRIDHLPVGHAARSTKLVTSARSLIAVAYTAAGRHEDALRVMRFDDFQSLQWQRKHVLAQKLQRLGLGRDTVAWGVLVKAFTKLGRPDIAVAVVDAALARDVGLTDSLLHLTIDALRALGRPRQAEWLFDEAVQKGLQPRERTVASLLLALVSKSERRTMDTKRIEELVDMIPEPTPRFKHTSLVVLTAAGSLQRFESLFADIAGERTPTEHAFAALMGGYEKHFKIGWESSGVEEDTKTARMAVADRVEGHWQAYLEAYGGSRAQSVMLKRVRGALLFRYLRVQMMCFRLDEAIDVLEQVADDRIVGLEIATWHVTGMLGAVEMACDVHGMDRVLKVMEKLGMVHDVRTVTFCVGTYLGDGNIGAALAMVRKEAPRLLANGYRDENLKQYHWSLLERRLGMLASALREVGKGKVKDLESFIAITRLKLSS